jgi:homopolymeric O-antigen transport system permease protein
MSCPVVAHVHPSPRRGARHPILLRRSFTAAQPTFFAPCVNPVDLYDPQKHQVPQIRVSPVRAKQVRAPTNAREGRVPIGLLLNQSVDQRRTAGVRLGEVRSIDPPATAIAADEVVIVAGQTGRRYFQDLWRYRELFLFLAWRDLLVRYKQTVVGVGWSVIRPLLTMLILTLVFGRLGKMPSGGVPYPLLVFCGLLPWTFFATALSESGNSLVANSNLISKVYFPRLIVPASSVIISLADFLISLGFLFVLLVWYRFVPGWTLAVLPLFALLAFVAAFAVGVWVSALTVRYRDFRFIVPFAVQFGLYISPVGFFSKVVPPQWRLLYSLNPMVGVIDGFRWSVLGGQHTVYWPGLAASIVTSLLMLVTGIRYFRRTERTFADVI